MLLFLLVFLFAPYAAQSFRNVNTVSRLGLAHAVAVHRVLNIDAVAEHTVDKAHHGEHFYCDKAPGLSLLCVPAVAAADALSSLLGFAPALISPRTGHLTARYKLCAYACLLASSAWVYALAVVLFRRILAPRIGERAASLVTLLCAFGTPPLLWATTLFGHAAAAGFLFIGLALGLGAGGPSTAPRLRWGLAGLALGMAVLCEFTALPAAALVTAFLMLGPGAAPELPLRRRACALFVGALGPALVLLAYNTLAFQHPFKLGYASVQGFAGMRTGFFGISVPRAAVAFDLLFSEYRGLFWLSPVLLPALIACAMALWQRGPERAFAALALGIAAYYLCLNAGYYYWDGGFSTGPRHITPIAPFLMLGLGLMWQRLSRPLRALFTGVGTLSVVITTTCALVRVTAPDDGASMLQAHVLPRLLAGEGYLLPQRLGASNAFSIALAFTLIGAASYALLKEPDAPQER